MWWRGTMEGRNKRELQERRIPTLRAEGSGCSFPEEWNLPKPQLSSISVHRHIAILATQPNKPLDRISFLIRHTVLGSTQPRSQSVNSGPLTATITVHTILLIRGNCVCSCVYLSAEMKSKQNKTGWTPGTNLFFFCFLQHSRLLNIVFLSESHLQTKKEEEDGFNKPSQDISKADVSAWSCVQLPQLGFLR